MCKRNNSQFTYDYEGDDPDLWTPPRKKRRTKTVQKLTHDVIIDLDTGKLKCDDLNQYLHLPTNPSLFHFCHCTELHNETLS